MAEMRDIKKVMKRDKFSAALFLLFILYFVLGSLKASGFCFSEGRNLSERELLEQYVLRSRIFKIEGDEISEKVAREINFPECCKIYNIPQFVTKFDVYARPFIFGERLYGIDAYYLDKDKLAKGDKYPALIMHGDIESCGNKSDIDLYSSTETAEYFYSMLKRNKKPAEDK
jgi:hypothetical protein